MEKTQSVSAGADSGAQIVDRMQQAYGCQNMAALAVALSEEPSTVKNWRYRGQVPLKHLVKTSKDTKRSLDWLVLGRDGAGSERVAFALPMPSEGHHAAQNTAHSSKMAVLGTYTPSAAYVVDGAALVPERDASDDRPLVLSLEIREAGRTLDYNVIPKLCGGAHAGPATASTNGRVVVDKAGEMALTADWLARNLHHTTGDLASVQVIGDSMSPTLLDGDTIIIDRGVRELNVDAIYVVHMMGQRLVKRVQRKFDGSVVIISDNTAYERETVPRGRVAEIEVLGRMVWPRVR